MAIRATILPPRPARWIMAWAALNVLGFRVMVLFTHALDVARRLLRRARSALAPAPRELSPVPPLADEERLSSLIRRLVAQQAARRTRPLPGCLSADRPTAVECKRAS